MDVGAALLWLLEAWAVVSLAALVVMSVMMIGMIALQPLVVVWDGSPRWPRLVRLGVGLLLCLVLAGGFMVSPWPHWWGGG